MQPHHERSKIYLGIDVHKDSIVAALAEGGPKGEVRQIGERHSAGMRLWKHSRFNIHRSQRVPPGNREDMERLAQYLIRNPFSVEKMRPNSSGDSIIYRSGMNPKIGRNFEVFSPLRLHRPHHPAHPRQKAISEMIG